jgi:hypothetical protein
MSRSTVRSFLGIILSICFILQPSLFAGLTPETKIKTPAGMVCIENLKVGDAVCGYDLENNTFPVLKIENIEPVNVESIYVITTQQGTISASADQLFYELTSQKFIPVEQFKAGDAFLTKDGKVLECLLVEHQQTQTTVYELTLEEPHLFFSSEAQVLTHNLFPALTFYISPPVVAAAVPVLKCVVGAGIIAGAYCLKEISTFSLPIIFGGSKSRGAGKAERSAPPAMHHEAERKQSPRTEPQRAPQPMIDNTTSGDGGQSPDPHDPKKNDNEEKTKAKDDRTVTKYQDVTDPRSRCPNIGTDISKAEFEKNLLEENWTRSLAKGGEAIIYKKDGAKYVIREEALSTGKATADYYKPGSPDISTKIRFDIV